MRVLAIVNQKGGVGKTPTVWEISAALAARGLRVIMADLDPQGTLSAGTLGADGLDHGSAELLLGERTLPDAVQKTSTQNLSILAAHHARLSSAEKTLSADGVDGFVALCNALENHEDAADILVCDCPPNLSVLTGNALTAANYVIVPVDSTQAQVALSQLKRTITSSKRLNPEIRVLGAILTKFAAHQTLSSNRFDAISADEFFPNVWPVRLSGGFEKAFRAGKPLRAIASSAAERAAVAEIDAIATVIAAAMEEGAAA
jgi:chromosome partitioning protein